MGTKARNGTEQQALNMAAKFRTAARHLHGDKPGQTERIETLLQVAEELESAVRLCSGPLPDRSAHWRVRLPELIASASDRIGKGSQLTAPYDGPGK